MKQKDRESGLAKEFGTRCEGARAGMLLCRASSAAADERAILAYRQATTSSASSSCSFCGRCSDAQNALEMIILRGPSIYDVTPTSPGF